MGYTGINLGNVKNSNRSSILKLLNDRGAMSRKDIAGILGLTPATVTLICADLIASGALQEKGEMEEEKRAGRKKVLIDIHYQYRYVLTISIEAADTWITVADLKGTCLGSKCIRTESGMEPELFLKAIADEGKILMWEFGISRERILGAGVSVPGPVKRISGISQHAYRIWQEAVAVKEILERYLEFPVIVENNVRAFAEGELIYGVGKEWENLLFVKWGPGVGSAIIIGNQVYDSQNSKTAEIGHCIVKRNGDLCRCGRRGCLETVAAARRVAERVREACGPDTMPELYALVEGDTDRIETKNMNWWLEAEDQALWDIMDEAIDEIARVSVNTITMLAPDKVIVYGYMFELPHVKERFLEHCAGYDASYNREYILESELAEKISFIGPLAVAVNELFLMAKSGVEV